ncbi:hypothetical protein FRB93_006930 [Tulasnella sp. JGI-2019a]|nr:hypothetical protein FRB93_006930 [Tulasnella sp. JGI-2019a]
MLKTMISRTIEFEAAASEKAITCLHNCYRFGVAQLTAPPSVVQSHLEPTKTLLKVVEANVPFLVPQWWKRYRHTVPSLLRQNTFLGLCGNFMVICHNTSGQEGDITKQGYRGPDHIQYTLLDFFMTYAVGAFYDTPNDRLIVAQCLLGPIKLSSANPDLTKKREFPTVSALLRLRPTTAHERIEEVLASDEGTLLALRPAVIFTSWLIEMTDMHQSVMQGGDLAQSFIMAYWRMHPSDGKTEVVTQDETMLVITVIIRLLTVSPELTARRTSGLLKQCDFLSLIERMLIEAAEPTTTVDYYLPEMWDKIKSLLSCCPDALETPLRRDFLYVLDHLKALAGDVKTNVSPVSLMRFWRDLGDVIGLKEEKLRAELKKEMKRRLGDAVGCNWIECAAFNLELDPCMTFRCASCKKTVYCGVLCQKRDWEEGGHGSRCGK